MPTSPHCGFVTYRTASHPPRTVARGRPTPPPGPQHRNPIPLSSPHRRVRELECGHGSAPAGDRAAGRGGGGGGGAPPGRRLRRGVGFRSLKMVSVSMDEPLPAEPVGVAYGRLANGLAYYVRSNPKPRMRAALSLAVKVGSVLPRSLPPTISRVCFLISRRVRA